LGKTNGINAFLYISTLLQNQYRIPPSYERQYMRNSAKNIIANFINRIWGFLALYLFSRINLGIVGPDQFGVISYYALILLIVSFADVGMSATITREFAKQASDGYLRGLLRFFEKIYIAVSIACGAIICLLAKPITTYWLVSDKLSQNILEHYIYLIGISAATQFVSLIYFGAIMGKEKQVWANATQIVFNIIKVVGGTLLLFLYSENLYLFFCWQILCNLAFFFVLRNYVYKLLKVESSTAFTGVSKEMWRYMGSMALASLLSSVGVQSDKLVASKFLLTTDYGYFSLASTLSQLPVMVIVPVAMAIFPVFVRHYSLGDVNRLHKVYETVLFGIFILVVPLGFVLSLYGEDIFRIWLSTRNLHSAPAEISMVILLLTVGNAFQALQLPSYQYLMAKGNTRPPLYQSTVETILILPFMAFFMSRYGLIGLGIPWAMLKLFSFIYLQTYTLRIISKTSRIPYGKIIVLPIFVSAAVTLGLYFVYTSLPNNTFTTLGSIVLTMGASILLSIIFFDKDLLHPSKFKKLFK